MRRKYDLTSGGIISLNCEYISAEPSTPTRTPCIYKRRKLLNSCAPPP